MSATAADCITCIESDIQPCLVSPSPGSVQTSSGVPQDELKRWLAAARNYRYNISLLACEVGLSPKQLRCKFEARGWGCPKRFLDSVRANHASNALACGRTAKEVAVEFHYHDSAHLSRALKKHLGFTPSQIVAQRMKALCHLSRFDGGAEHNRGVCRLAHGRAIQH